VEQMGFDPRQVRLGEGIPSLDRTVFGNRSQPGPRPGVLTGPGDSAGDLR
jgi:hypothetical protein